MRHLAARVARVIRIDEAWLAVEPLDMRAGFDTALARVITVFGGASAPCLPLCQPAGQSPEGAGSRRNRDLAGSATAERGTVRLASSW